MSVIYIDSYRFGAAYDPDAAAYIARVEGTSGDNQALETAVKDAINAFVVGCKADGIWNAIKASAILAGARTLNGALQPLVGTAPNKFGTAANWNYDRKDGLQGDGSTNYLDSNRNNNADPQDSKHVSVYASTLGSASSAYIGSGIGSTTGISQIYSLESTGRYGSRSNSSTLYSGGPQVIGLLAWSRGSSSGYIARYGNTDYSISSASQTPNNNNLIVYNLPGLNYHTNARLAFYSIGEALDLALLDARVTTLINAFAAAIP